MADSQYNLIVIGAGPAGSALAISAAKAGISVLIVEKSTFPRHRPGESLHPGVEPILQQLGVWEAVSKAGFIRNPGIRNQWSGEEHFAAFGNRNQEDWQGIQAVRAPFDELLLQEALRHPTVQLLQEKAIDPIVEQGKVVGINTRQGAIHSEYVLDATGTHQWLAKRLKLSIRKSSPPLRAYYGYAQGICDTVGDSPWLQSTETGWLWLAKLGAERYTWTYLPFSEKPLRKDWMPAVYASLRPEGPMYASDVSWRIATPCAGNGYFLLGDAAFVLDPTSSHGVLKAMMSGIKAAHLITHARDGNVPAPAAARLYHQWVAEWFDKEVLEMRKMYQKMTHPPAWCREN